MEEPPVPLVIRLSHFLQGKDDTGKRYAKGETGEKQWISIAKCIDTEYAKGIDNYRYMWANFMCFMLLSLLAVAIGCMMEPFGPITNERMIRSFEYLLESMALIVAILIGNDATSYTATMTSWESCLNSVYTFHSDLKLYKKRHNVQSDKYDAAMYTWTSRAILLAIGAKAHAVRRKQSTDGAMSFLRIIFRFLKPSNHTGMFSDYQISKSQGELMSECQQEFKCHDANNADLYQVGTSMVTSVIETQRKLSEQVSPSGVTAYIYITTMTVMVYVIVQSDGDLYSGIFSAYIIALSVLLPVFLVSTGSVKSYSFKLKGVPGFKSRVYFEGADTYVHDCIDEIKRVTVPLGEEDLLHSSMARYPLSTKTERKLLLR